MPMLLTISNLILATVVGWAAMYHLSVSDRATPIGLRSVWIAQLLGAIISVAAMVGYATPSYWILGDVVMTIGILTQLQRDRRASHRLYPRHEKGPQ